MAGLTFDDVIGTPAAAPAPAAVPVAALSPRAGAMTFDDITGPASSPGQPALLNIPVPVSATSAIGSTDPNLNPDGEGLTQDQIDAAIRARFTRQGAEGRANLAALPGNVNNTVRAAANAVPLVGGLADRLDAATSAALGGDYGASLAQQQGQDQQFGAAHPYVAGAAGLAGAGAGTMAMLPNAALGLGGGSLIGRMATAGAAQGALGGADAAVRGENVASGAVVGGIGGMAGPALGAGAGAAYRFGAGIIPQAVPEALQGYSKTARSWLQRGVGDASPADLQAASDALGPAGMLGERSPGLLDLTQSVATNNGAGKAVVRDAFTDRAAGTGGRVMSDVDAALGPAQNPTPVAQAIQDARGAVTQPYFAQAFANGQPYTPELAALVQRPAVASAMQDAATSAANAGRPLGSITLDAVGQPVASDAAMQAYEAGQRPAVTDALARLMGTDPTAPGPLAAQDALAAQRSAAADPLYQAYRGMNVPMTPELADVLSRPSVASAIPAAERKAQDQGRTIFARGGSGFERDPVGSGDVSEVPADLPEIPPFLEERAPSRPAPVGMPRPIDLHGFVRSLGGIQDRGGDLAAMGLDNLAARPGQGLGADAMRQAAAQMGYLNHTVDGTTDGAARFSTVNHLLDALGSDNPIHSVRDADAVAAWEARDAAQAAYERGGAARGDVGRDVGMRPAAPGLPFGGPDASPSGYPGAPQLTPEGIDYLKRTLGDRIDTAQRSGNRDDARVFTGLQQHLLGAIERHPDPAIADAYGAARRAYAGPSREIEALNAGRAAFADSVTPEQVQREYAALRTDGERQRYRDGMFSAGRDKLAKVGDTRAFVDMVAGNEAIRSKFGAVAPHRGAIDAFNAAMDQARQRFTQAQRPTPEALHQTLQALDARAARGEAGVVEARDALAEHMSRDPYYAHGRAQDQSYGALEQAMADGRTALRTGPNALHPDDFADRFGARTGAGQAAERVTMRAALDSGLRQQPNDLQVLARQLQGEDGFNAAKIGTAFGQDAADALRATVDREKLYGANKQAVMGGSVTGERQQVRDLTQPDVKTGFLGYLSNMRPLDQPATILPPFLHPQTLGEKLYAGRYEAARNEIAPLLASHDRETVDPLLVALVQANARRGVVAPLNTDRLVRAIAGSMQGGRQLVDQ